MVDISWNFCYRIKSIECAITKVRWKLLIRLEFYILVSCSKPTFSWFLLRKKITKIANKILSPTYTFAKCHGPSSLWFSLRRLFLAGSTFSCFFAIAISSVFFNARVQQVIAVKQFSKWIIVVPSRKGIICYLKRKQEVRYIVTLCGLAQNILSTIKWISNKPVCNNFHF